VSNLFGCSRDDFALPLGVSGILDGSSNETATQSCIWFFLRILFKQTFSKNPNTQIAGVLY